MIFHFIRLEYEDIAFAVLDIHSNFTMVCVVHESPANGIFREGRKQME